jgi:hypothetical protein
VVISFRIFYHEGTKGTKVSNSSAIRYNFSIFSARQKDGLKFDGGIDDISLSGDLVSQKLLMPKWRHRSESMSDSSVASVTANVPVYKKAATKDGKKLIGNFKASVLIRSAVLPGDSGNTCTISVNVKAEEGETAVAGKKKHETVALTAKQAKPYLKALGRIAACTFWELSVTRPADLENPSK